MAINYAKQFSKRVQRTPQQEPIPGSNQVANNAGGFSWQITPWQKFERFLILGAEGGTYYIKEKELIKQSHDATVACIKEDGLRAVKLIVDVSHSGRAYKNDPAVFALALVLTYGNDDAKAMAYHALPQVCRIGTHLFHFAEYVNALRGWGRGLRKAVAHWYTGKSVEKLALQAIKYQQRDGWSHRDMLRLAHPRTDNDEQNAILRWMVGGMDALKTRDVSRKEQGEKKAKTAHYKALTKHLPELIEAFEEAKTADVKTLVKLILKHELPREAIPTEKLNSIQVWEALFEKMPMTAMIRNLGKMTSIGLIKPLSGVSATVINRLANAEALKKARVHPMQVLIANRIYGQGRGDKGSLTWEPVPAVVSALDEAFYLAFGAVKPVGKPLLFALDVSGSMSSPMAGTCISCCEATAALSLIHCSVEPNMHVMGFADRFVDLGIRKGMTLAQETTRAQKNNFGSTDCSMPMEWAIKNKVKVGGFVIMTDNETGSYSTEGQQHPSQALTQYRKEFEPEARQVVVGMTANDFTIAAPSDRFSLDVVGFDASAPNVIADFIRGDGGEVATVEDAD